MLVLQKLICVPNFYRSRIFNKVLNLSKHRASDDVSKRPVFIPEEVSLNDPPTTCCMSGCANCVYIAWAEALSKKMCTANPDVAKKILDEMKDPAMKAFLRMELQSRGLL